MMTSMPSTVQFVLNRVYYAVAVYMPLRLTLKTIGKNIFIIFSETEEANGTKLSKSNVCRTPNKTASFHVNCIFFENC